jgi:serine/threonine protein kinase
MNWKLGESILDTYRVERVFESGGMGLVYQVRHLHWNCDLALKQPRASFLRSREDVLAFEEEIETWSRLGLHPNVVTCHYSRRMDGIPCVFSEFVMGGSLSEWIHNRRLYEGEDAEVLARLLKVAIQFAHGLGWAHRQGFVHQDVKPGNVLMAEDETAKVSDFGLARHLKPSNMALAPSHTARVSGFTRPYASPEQLRGGFVSTSTDMWSWAVSILEMFMGGLVWSEGSIAPMVFREFLAQGARGRNLPQMPPGISRLLSKCLRIDTCGHPRSFVEIAEAVEIEYKKLFGDDPDIEAPDPQILRADSLNNRAISLLDVGRYAEAPQLLAEALRENPHHLEASYNLAILKRRTSRLSVLPTVNALEAFVVSPAYEWRRARLLAWAWAAENRLSEARKVLARAGDNTLSPSESAEHQLIQANLHLAVQSPPFALAPARPATELNAEAARFRRLLPKAQAAIADNRTDDAQRYLLMLGDLPDYVMQPELRALRLKFLSES